MDVKVRCANDAPIQRSPSLGGARDLLKAASLPYEDLSDRSMLHFFYVGSDTHPEAIVGLELFGQSALLRSLVVAPTIQRRGIGRRLVEEAESYAHACGVQEIFLLTNTAESFFNGSGYEVVNRDEAPVAIRESREFASICPASAALMMKAIG